MAKLSDITVHLIIADSDTEVQLREENSLYLAIIDRLLDDCAQVEGWLDCMDEALRDYFDGKCSERDLRDTLNAIRKTRNPEPAAYVMPSDEWFTLMFNQIF